MLSTYRYGVYEILEDGSESESGEYMYSVYFDRLTTSETNFQKIFRIYAEDMFGCMQAEVIEVTIRYDREHSSSEVSFVDMPIMVVCDGNIGEGTGRGGGTDSSDSQAGCSLTQNTTNANVVWSLPTLFALIAIYIKCRILDWI